MHNGVYKIGKLAFYNCHCLERISGATGVQVIDMGAFYRCRRLKYLEFGEEKLERICQGAFSRCASLHGLKIPSVEIVGSHAFQYCVKMTDVEFGERLERMEGFTFLNCYSLRRVVVPLQKDLISYNIFKGCTHMANVDLVGEVRNTISRFNLQVWKDEMEVEIGKIMQDLAAAPIDDKTTAVQQWIRRVHARVEHFTNEHNNLLKESAILLELSLWQGNLVEIDHDMEEEASLELEAKPRKKAKTDFNGVRQERRMTCGADVVIKNVLSFLQLD